MRPRSGEWAWTLRWALLACLASGGCPTDPGDPPLPDDDTSGDDDTTSPTDPAVVIGVSAHLERENIDTAALQFETYVARLREYVDLFEAHGALLTVESRQLTRGVVTFDDNVLLEMQDAGHAIGIHADMGEQWPYNESHFFHELTSRWMEMEFAGIEPRHVSGICSRLDWVSVAADVGFEFTTGQTEYCLKSLPVEQQPRHIQVCSHPTLCHRTYPYDVEHRLYPWPVADGATWTSPVEEGPLVLLHTGGMLNCLHEEEGTGEAPLSCEFDDDDVETYLALLERALAAAEPGKPGAFFVVWSYGSDLDDEQLERWLAAIDPYVDEGLVTWGTAFDVIDDDASR